MATTNIQSFFGDVEVTSGSITTNSLEINGVVNPFFPIGSIIIWYSATIPTGWVLCNGTNGTPNLQGKYLLGANGNLGSTTNNYNVTLAVGNLPAHKHNGGSIGNAGGHKHYFYVPSHDINNCDSQGWDGFSAYKSSDRTRQAAVNAMTSPITHNHNVTMNNVGAGGSISIEPPYYTLKYIMKTA